MTVSVSDVLAAMALVLSIFSTWKTIQFNSQQRSLLEGQAALNRRLLEREETEASDAKAADLGVSVYRLGGGRFRCKIFNKGQASARNVAIEFPEGNDWFIKTDVERLFPLESLDPHQSVELVAAIAHGSRAKHAILLRWDDDNRTGNSWTAYATR